MPKRHTDREYESALRSVRENILRMAGRVEKMIADCARALVTGDTDLARATIEADREVNRIEVELDEQCLLILAKRQPLASDLRFITLAMKMVTDLERIGDLAVNISERVEALGSEPEPSIGDKSQRMADIAQSMVRDSIDAFIEGDVTKAHEVFERDQEIDDLYKVVSDLVQASMAQSGDFVDRGVHLQAVAKFLERIGDHGTNLAELVVFLVEGKDVRHRADYWDTHE